jgi:hypothetical protein
VRSNGQDLASTNEIHSFYHIHQPIKPAKVALLLMHEAFAYLVTDTLYPDPLYPATHDDGSDDSLRHAPAPRRTVARNVDCEAVAQAALLPVLPEALGGLIGDLARLSKLEALIAVMPEE